MYEYVQFEVVDGVAILTLNRPDKRNALKRDFIVEINQCLKAIRGDESVRVLLLKASGKVFCAGMDLGEMQERAQAEDKENQWHQDSLVYCEMLTGIYQLPVPTVAVVQGPALAGGMGIVLACDIMVASNEVFFSLPEPMRGITAAMVTPFLIHRVGNGPATYCLLSGKRITADDAFRLGMVHQLVAPDQLEPEVQELVASILTGSPNALAITKKHVDNCTVANILEQVQASIAVSAEARETEDAREGLAAFLEKRKPNWMSAE